MSDIDKEIEEFEREFERQVSAITSNDSEKEKSDPEDEDAAEEEDAPREKETPDDPEVESEASEGEDEADTNEKAEVRYIIDESYYAEGERRGLSRHQVEVLAKQGILKQVLAPSAPDGEKADESQNETATDEADKELEALEGKIAELKKNGEDDAIVGVLQALHASTKRIVTQFNEERKQAEERRIQEDGSATEKLVDAFAEKAPQALKDKISDKPWSSLDPKSPESQNRMALLKEAIRELNGFKATGETPPPADKLLEMAARNLFGVDTGNARVSAPNESLTETQKERGRKLRASAGHEPTSTRNAGSTGSMSDREFEAQWQEKVIGR